MEENRKKSPGLIYAIIGVFIFIISIVGSTYAYFSAEASTDGINGEALDINLELSVKMISPSTGSLVPILDGSKSGTTSQLHQAASSNCIDSNGNTVCQIYEITTANTGSDDTNINISITLNKETVTNLKWASMSNATTVLSVHDSTDTDVSSNIILVAGQTSKFYIMIYINETQESQNTTDKASFSGVITVSASTGSQVTATFNT